MPHGIKIDHNSNLWLTDVAMHQVFKFNFKISQDPVLVLGTAFVKATDDKHFCMPADVGFTKSNGDIFVADGCNQRVVRFDVNGEFIKNYEDKINPLVKSHSVSLIDELNLVCTVSRDQGRIVCFDIDTGIKKFDLTNQNMNSVFSLSYDHINKLLYATGFKDGVEAVGLTFEASGNNFGIFLQKWNTQGHVTILNY
jgi:outer membrane protein assembly factor BamB